MYAIPVRYRASSQLFPGPQRKSVYIRLENTDRPNTKLRKWNHRVSYLGKNSHSVVLIIIRSVHWELRRPKDSSLPCADDAAQVFVLHTQIVCGTVDINHLQYYLLFYNFCMLKNYNTHRRGETLLKTTRHLTVILVLMPKRCAQYCVWVKNKSIMFTFRGNLTIPFISTLIH